MNSGRDPTWRVFISHTAELRDYPKGKSYVEAVKDAVIAAGHVPVNMQYFPSVDRPPAQLCAEQVQGCDVYVGVLGTRYGSPVRDRPDVSYTELEFETATEAGLARLMFLLDTDADGVGIPPSQLLDREFGHRQDAFRDRVKAGQLTKVAFDSPASLGQLVERSLQDLAKTHRRIDSGIQREQVPAEAPPVRSSKFVNPPPTVAPTWFQNRQVQTGLLAGYVTDPGIRMVTVVGRGGIGKTAMVCRLLKGFEAGRIPDVEGALAEIRVGGIVYLSRNGVHQVDYPSLFADLVRLLPTDAGQKLLGMYQDPQHTPTELMLALLDAFPAGEPVVVLLDNLESVMDAERETIAEHALHEALSVVLTAPAHAVTVIATTRVRPAALLTVEPSRQRQLPLDEGLGSPEAEIVLRELDDDGHLGLRNAPDALLDGLRRHTRGFPRALEAVKAILDGDDTLTPQDLLDRTRNLPEDRVVEVLVGEAYDLLDTAAQQVMQALAVYPTPVSAVGVDFLLLPVNPTTDAAPILARLVRRQLVRFADRRFFLHPVDRDYARSQLLSGAPGDSTAALTLSGLEARAADYYAQIRTPRESWHTLDDVQPQLAEFELRCAIGDYDTAAAVLADIDFDYLRVWGHYRTLVDLHERIDGRITDPDLNVNHLSNLGSCYDSLGDYRRAIELHSQCLDIARESRKRAAEGAALGNLGSCYYSLGSYRQAIDLQTASLALARETNDRAGEGACLGNLGLCYYSLGDYRRAIDLHAQCLAIARETGNRFEQGAALGNLGLCYSNLGEHRRAIDLHTQSMAVARETRNRDGEGAALGNLGGCHYRLGDYRQAIELLSESAAVAREVGNRTSEGAALGNLGLCHYTLGDHARAIGLQNLSLAIDRETGNRAGEGVALGNLASSHHDLGNYGQAIDLHTVSLDIARETGDRDLECVELGNLGTCSYSVGNYPRAIELHTEALAIARDIGTPYSEASELDYLGRAWLASGDADQAVTLLREAVKVADSTGNIEPAVEARSGLARAHLQLGDPAAALATASAARERPYPREEPALLLLQGVALLQLQRADEALPAFGDALAAADALLALSERNVSALQVRALALSGYAAVSGDAAWAGEAAEAFGQARAVTTAAGVVADALRLLDAIVAQDSVGILVQVLAGLRADLASNLPADLPADVPSVLPSDPPTDPLSDPASDRPAAQGR